MGVSFVQFPLIGFKGSILVVLGIALLFFLGMLIDKKRKAPNNRALLKNLLEDLGLDVPLELQDSNRAVIKSFKKS